MKTQDGRYRLVSAVTSRLNSVYQVMGEMQFRERLGQLDHFLELVTTDKDFMMFALADIDIHYKRSVCY